MRDGEAIGECYLCGYAGGGVEDGACCVALLADVVEEGFVFDFDERIACREVAVGAYECGGVLLAVPILERQFAFCREARFVPLIANAAASYIVSCSSSCPEE